MSDKYDEHIGQILNTYRFDPDDDWYDDPSDPDMDFYSGFEYFHEADWGAFKPLFRTVGYPGYQVGYPPYGCITQVKRGKHISYTPKLTEEIQNSDEFHPTPDYLYEALEEAKTYEEMVDILWPYAEFQRRMDREFPNDRLTQDM